MTTTSDYPFSAETGGYAARRFHAEHGSPLPVMDLAARNTSPKVYSGAKILGLAYPPPAWNGVDATHPEGLNCLLTLLYGANRIEWSRGGVGIGRSVPSGGGAYPGELYLATEFGLCHYLPSTHALELLRPDDLRVELADLLRPAPEPRPEVFLLFTSRHDANLARYGGFGHRLQALDTGVLAGQASALLNAAGMRARVHGIFEDERLGRSLGLDPAVESVRAVVTAAYPDAVGDQDTNAGVADVVARTLRRHTPRSGFAVAPIERARLVSLLDEADVATPVDFSADLGVDATVPTEPDLHCVAGRVSGLPAGCHRFDRASRDLLPGLAAVTPRALFAPGSPGELAGYESACAVLITGDYEHGYAKYGDRWYRLLNLLAGILGLRISLAAAGAGLAAGLRCDFITPQADRLLGDPDRTVLMTVLIGHERAAPTPSYPLFSIEDGR
jgi:SagB-type dehydrogenase family enzyme